MHWALGFCGGDRIIVVWLHGPGDRVMSRSRVMWWGWDLGLCGGDRIMCPGDRVFLWWG